MVANTLRSPEEAFQFFEKLNHTRSKFGAEATICVNMDVVVTCLKVGRTSDCKATIEDAREKLTKINSNETIVFSKFYKASLEFRKVFVSSIYLYIYRN